MTKEELKVEELRIGIELQKIELEHARALAKIEIDERMVQLETAKMSRELLATEIDRNKRPSYFMGTTVRPCGDAYECVIVEDGDIFNSLSATGSTPAGACRQFDNLWVKG